MTGAVVKALRECPLPIIAAVNGVAAGAGSVIALASDFRLLARSASFAFLFTRVGSRRRRHGLGVSAAAARRPRPRDGAAGARAKAHAPSGRSRSGWRRRWSTTTSCPPRRKRSRAGWRTGRRSRYSTTKVLLTRELDIDLASAIELEALGQALHDAERGSPRVLRRVVRRTPACVEREMTGRPPHRQPARAGRAERLRARGRRRARAHRVPGRAGRATGETLVEQFDAAAANVVAALRAAGGAPDDLVSLVVYTTDVEEYRASLAELGEVWRRHFGRRYPALALVGASALFDPEARVELMGVAVVPDG